MNSLKCYLAATPVRRSTFSEWMEAKQIGIPFCSHDLAISRGVDRMHLIEILNIKP